MGLELGYDFNPDLMISLNCGFCVSSNSKAVFATEVSASVFERFEIILPPFEDFHEFGVRLPADGG